MRNNFIKAFTLIEILFVISILGILLAIVLPQFNNMRSNQILNSSVADIVSVINKASSQSLASLDSSVYGVRFDSDKVTIFKGTSFDVNSPTNEIVLVNSPASISNISLTGGVASFYFNRLTGIPSATGNVTVTVSSVSKSITIDSLGKISTN